MCSCTRRSSYAPRDRPETLGQICLLAHDHAPSLSLSLLPLQLHRRTLENERGFAIRDAEMLNSHIEVCQAPVEIVQWSRKLPCRLPNPHRRCPNHPLRPLNKTPRDVLSNLRYRSCNRCPNANSACRCSPVPAPGTRRKAYSVPVCRCTRVTLKCQMRKDPSRSCHYDKPRGVSTMRCLGQYSRDQR